MAASSPIVSAKGPFRGMCVRVRLRKEDSERAQHTDLRLRCHLSEWWADTARLGMSRLARRMITAPLAGMVLSCLA